MNMATKEWLILSLGIYGVTAVVSLLYILLHRKLSPFDSIVQFILFYSLFVLPLPVRSYLTLEPVGNVTPHLPALFPYMPLAVLLAAMGLAIMLLAYFSPLPQRLAGWMPAPPDTRPQDKPWLAFVIIGGFSIFLIALLVKDIGFLSFLLSGYSSSKYTFGKGHLAAGFPWLIAANLFLLYQYAIKRNKLVLAIFLALTVALTLMNLMMGNRSQVLYMVLAIAIFWHFAIRPFSFTKVAMLGTLVFLALNIWGLLRGSNYDTPAAFIETTATRLTSIAKSEEGAQGIFYTLTIGEFVVPFETLPQMVASVGNEVAPEYGMSYLRAFAFFIPSALYPDRPLPLSTWYMREFYSAGENLNEGRQFFFLAEGYLNFGVTGVMLTAALWGLLLGAMDRYRRIHSANHGAILIYALFVAFLFRLIAGDFVSLLVGFPQQALVMAVLGLLIAKGITKWRLA